VNTREGRHWSERRWERWGDAGAGTQVRQSTGVGSLGGQAGMPALCSLVQLCLVPRVEHALAGDVQQAR
jgi:hypothetical protein